jgi:hypothetical protein
LRSRTSHLTGKVKFDPGTTKEFLGLMASTKGRAMFFVLTKKKIEVSAESSYSTQSRADEYIPGVENIAVDQLSCCVDKNN